MVLPLISLGMIDASITRRPSMPRTLSSWKGVHLDVESRDVGAAADKHAGRCQRADWPFGPGRSDTGIGSRISGAIRDGLRDKISPIGSGRNKAADISCRSGP